MKVGIIGSLNSGKQILVDYLGRESIKPSTLEESKSQSDTQDFFIVYKEIPIRIKTYTGKTITQAIYDYEKLENLDVLIIVLNLYDFTSLKLLNKKELEELYDYIMFQGVSVLVGIQEEFSSQYRINEVELIQKAKELEILYCFALEGHNGDIREFYEKILNDFIFKFQFSSPEMFEHAKEYGLMLKQRDKIRQEIRETLSSEAIIDIEDEPFVEEESLLAEDSKEALNNLDDPSVVAVEGLRIVKIESDDQIEDNIYWKPKHGTEKKGYTLPEEFLKKETSPPLEETPEIITIEKALGIRSCPRCYNQNKLLIHESVDKTNIILDTPRLYGKKFRCGICGCLWREKQQIIS